MTVIRVRIHARHRGAERFWTVCLVLLLLAGLDQLSHALAVGALLVGIGCWAVVAIGRNR